MIPYGFLYFYLLFPLESFFFSVENHLVMHTIFLHTQGSSPQNRLPALLGCSWTYRVETGFSILSGNEKITSLCFVEILFVILVSLKRSEPCNLNTMSHLFINHVIIRQSTFAKKVNLSVKQITQVKTQKYTT